ncbi:MAG: macro domain-containing protein [Eubacteriales bacterium]|nr:macro domain-containing protein [Eubacteriales bacterium]
MPLQIVRNDITAMNADAIVNSTNNRLKRAGTGVDASIHAAAGEKLEKALEEIGYCPTGSAVITESYNIPGCRYIIHAVSPVYSGGEEGEEQLLKSCYKKIFSLALSHGCSSLAMPVLCSGANEYPKKQAYEIATSCAREFLMKIDGEMMIYLVVFNSEIVGISEEQNDEVTAYITDNYVNEKKRKLGYPRGEGILHSAGFPDIGAPAHSFNYPSPPASLPKASSFFPDADNAPLFLGHLESSEDELTELCNEISEPDYRIQDKSFGDMCAWWMERKKMTPHDFYCKANLTRAAFFNLKKHAEQTPRKTTAFACVIGLKLAPDEAEDLLMRAGLAFSPYYRTDVIVKNFISEGEYNIDTINMELFENDLSLLGSV